MSLSGIRDLSLILTAPYERLAVRTYVSPFDSLTITEAMCTGMPVVTSDYSTMNEWIDDDVQGRLIKIAKIKKSSMPMHKVTIDTDHLAAIMLDYLKYPDKVREHSINARKTIEEKYNWDDGEVQTR